MSRARAALLGAALVLAIGSRASAYDFELSAETIGQGYTLRAGDDTLVNRRRLTQYVGLNVFNLGPTDVYGNPLPRNQLYLEVQLRFDAELGDFANLQELSGRTPQSELRSDQLEVLWGFLGGRGLFGFLDFKLGRQLMVDLFDYQSFDGLSLQANTRFHVAMEAWGGLNVTGAAPFDSPVYRADGVALGQNPIGSLAARQEDALEPTFGFALKLIGLRDVQARLSYLRTMSFTNEPQPGEPESGVVDEKIGFTARGRLLAGRIVPWFGFRYNLLAGRLDEVQAGARFTLSTHHALQAEYVFSAPTFDGDSIWNVFASDAFNDLRVTYDLAYGRFRVFARGFTRFFAVDTASLGPPGVDLGPELAYGGSVGARADLGRGYLRLDGYYEDGYGGTKAGADLAARVRAFGDPIVGSGLSFEGRLSYVWFRDDSRTIDHAHSFGVQAGARYAFAHGLTLHLAAEENVNRFFASQFRLLAMLDISFLVGMHGRAFAPRQGNPGW
jgi:hypothetical protein